jgi:hypothetical protein
MKKLICSIFSIAMILTLNTSPIHAEDTGESSGGGYSNSSYGRTNCTAE